MELRRVTEDMEAAWARAEAAEEERMKSQRELVKASSSASLNSLPSQAPSFRSQMSIIGVEPFPFDSNTIEIGDELGTGAFSVVFRGVNKLENQDIAVKRIAKSRLKPNDLKGIKKEVAILSNMKHHHILPLHDFMDDDKFYYITTEIVLGGDMQEYLRHTNKPGVDVTRRVIHRLLSVCEYLQIRNVAHRDIKPENLFLRSNNDPIDFVLGDFGFAVVCQGRSLSTFCGSPSYVAPEVINTMNTGLTQSYDYRCDIWSVGAMAYEMLLGSIAFMGKDENQILRRVKKKMFTLPPEAWNTVDESAHNAVMMMLNEDQFTRPDASGALQHKWFDGLEAQDVAPEWEFGVCSPQEEDEDDSEEDGHEEVTTLVQDHSYDTQLARDSDEDDDPMTNQISQLDIGLKLPDVYNIHSSTSRQQRAGFRSPKLQTYFHSSPRNSTTTTSDASPQSLGSSASQPPSPDLMDEIKVWLHSVFDDSDHHQ